MTVRPTDFVVRVIELNAKDGNLPEAKLEPGECAVSTKPPRNQSVRCPETRATPGSTTFR